MSPCFFILYCNIFGQECVLIDIMDLPIYCEAEGTMFIAFGKNVNPEDAKFHSKHWGVKNLMHKIGMQIKPTEF